MNTRIIVAVIVVVVIVVIAGVGVSMMMASKTSSTTTPVASTTSTTSPTTSTTSTSSTTTSISISTSSSSTTSSAALSIEIQNSTTLGSYLTNGTGWTLYLFTKDTPKNGTSVCYGTCATFWPAFHGNASTLVLPAGLNASAFGTITRTDGTTQITYMGWPLYFYAGDKTAGQTNGQDKDGTWFVVNFPTLKIPANATETTSTTTSTTTTSSIVASQS